MRALLGVSRYWGGVIVVALATVAFAFWGWHLLYPDEYLYNAFRTLQLLVGEADQLEESNWQIDAAAVLAPIVLAAAAIRLGFDLLADRYQRWRINQSSGHTLICGCSEQARAFALNEAGHRRKTVIVAAKPSESDESFCAGHSIRLLRGDARDPGTLQAAAVERAAKLVAITGDDADNLEIVMKARELLAAAPARKHSLRAFASIDDRNLWSELARSDSIARRSENCTLGVFNLGDIVARRFFWDVPLYRYADLLDQPRIHAVFVGFGHYGEGLLLQMLRTCVYRDLEDPVVTVLCGDASAEEDRLRMHCPELDHVTAPRFVDIDVALRPLNEEILAEIDRRSPVTAVIVCLDSDEAALRSAIYTRDVIHRTGFWNAPVYVRIGSDTGIEDLIVRHAGSNRLDDLIEVFGSYAENCDFEIVDGGLETMARRIHKAYRTTQEQRLAGEPGPARQESLADWETLRETYKASNRRAADHIRAKLESAGCHMPPGLDLVAPMGFRLPREREVSEALAALEHRSWCTGMRLDGWRPAEQRNNRRREHDNLIAYELLDESLKEYDRDQIELIDKVLLTREALDPGAPAIRYDHWIGLIGRNEVTADEADWTVVALTGEVLERIAARYTDAHFTLLTPLAPGLDLVMTRAALAFFAEHGIAHRLLVVHAVPAERMLDDFRDAFEAGSAWNGSETSAAKHWVDSASPDASGRALIETARQVVLQSPACEWVIDLTRARDDYGQPDERRRGYQRAGDYVARRSHTLVAATRRDAIGKTGGIKETLERRGDELAVRYGNWPATMHCSTVVLEIDTHDVRLREHGEDRAGVIL